ncbi:MAG: valine--pyruvate transaminase [Gammaproteobacteria bacterium]
MNFSTFGARFSGRSGTRDLMDDLGAVACDPARWINLGGGNPSAIPALQALFDEAIATIGARRGWAALYAGYDSPQGYRPFLDALVDLLNAHFDWRLTPRHVMTTPGSQASFFMLFNLFGGTWPDGRRRRVLLPQSPEYIGYAQSSFEDGVLASCRSRIETCGEHGFRYRVDFDALRMDDDVAALCISRPSNPTGKLAADAEMTELAALARARDLPFIVDGAYGLPFPGIAFAPATVSFDANTVLCLSLSKLGLPGVRTGIVIAAPPIVDALVGMNAMLNLAPNPFGARVVCELMREHDLVTLSRELVQPHYAARSRLAQAIAARALDGLPYRLHASEGAIFLWLWFPGLPVSTMRVYTRLRERGVLVIPGAHFGPGLAAPWPHLDECLRVSYAQPEAALEAGFTALAEEIRAAYAGA